MPHHDLAVIIVSYNVKSFLHFCLTSVKAALAPYSYEIIVVDNHSKDDTIDFLNKHHNDITLVQNTENQGFAKACNQGLEKVRSEYVLFLNPDTIVGENFFQICSDLMKDLKIGAVGPKLMDGSGHYLPESKRGFPSIKNSLFKQSGIYRLFKSSSFFNGYYLGHLSPDHSHKIDVLTGAFLFSKTEIINNLGGFDESFFMYGEDIDLSYRITQAGYELAYTPETAVIHFKGESTHKNTWKYLSSFYGSMKIFVDKHFKTSEKWIMRMFLSLGVILSAIGFVVKRIIQKVALPILCTLLMSGILYVISEEWAQHYYHDPDHFDQKPLMFNIGLFSVVWTLSLLIHGHFSTAKRGSVLPAFIKGLLIILGVYALLPVEYRSSRAIILLSFIALTFIFSLLKWIILRLFISNYNNEIYTESSDHSLHVTLKKMGLIISKEKIVKRKVYEINKNSFHSIIDSISNKAGEQAAYFWDSDQKILIHSHQKSSQGASHEYARLYNILQPQQIFAKRAFDLSVSIIYLLFFPIWSVIAQIKYKSFKRIWTIIRGHESIIAYPATETLPLLKKGYWWSESLESEEEQTLHRKEYAMHYSLFKEIEIFIKHFRSIMSYLAGHDDN